MAMALENDVGISGFGYQSSKFLAMVTKEEMLATLTGMYRFGFRLGWIVLVSRWLGFNSTVKGLEGRERCLGGEVWVVRWWRCLGQKRIVVDDSLV
uniref:Uncharacterized protein n=1 Tax=Cannabis sativa TaxID=3483 RepID=A0A803P1V3_CANSA